MAPCESFPHGTSRHAQPSPQGLATIALRPERPTWQLTQLTGLARSKCGFNLWNRASERPFSARPASLADLFGCPAQDAGCHAPDAPEAANIAEMLSRVSLRRQKVGSPGCWLSVVRALDQEERRPDDRQPSTNKRQPKSRLHFGVLWPLMKEPADYGRGGNHAASRKRVSGGGVWQRQSKAHRRSTSDPQMLVNPQSLKPRSVTSRWTPTADSSCC